MTANSPRRYCTSCGKFEHGSVACEAVYASEQHELCHACDGRGGFNKFYTVPGSGTDTIWIHQWITCSLCRGD